MESHSYTNPAKICFQTVERTQIGAYLNSLLALRPPNIRDSESNSLAVSFRSPARRSCWGRSACCRKCSRGCGHSTTPSSGRPRDPPPRRCAPCTSEGGAQPERRVPGWARTAACCHIAKMRKAPEYEAVSQVRNGCKLLYFIAGRRAVVLSGADRARQQVVG